MTEDMPPNSHVTILLGNNVVIFLVSTPYVIFSVLHFHSWRKQIGYQNDLFALQTSSMTELQGATDFWKHKT